MRCLRGHEYTPENTMWSTGNSGKPQRSCKICKAMRWRLKYREDAGYREMKKAQVRAYKMETRC